MLRHRELIEDLCSIHFEEAPQRMVPSLEAGDVVEEWCRLC
jgi:hypothetical protein